jgi:hypothetical protein
MNPEWFPEMALLIAGLFAGGAALRSLFTRQRGGAVRWGAASLALVALALVLASSETLHPYIRRSREAHKPVVLLPVTLRDAEDQDSEGTPSTSLLLGNVLVRVAPSNRYVLAVDGKRFLTLDVDS